MPFGMYMASQPSGLARREGELSLCPSSFLVAYRWLLLAHEDHTVCRTPWLREARESDHAPIERPEAVSSGELCCGEETTPRISSAKLTESQPEAIFKTPVGRLGDENF